MSESIFLNVALRDTLNLLKLRVVKVVHSFIHRRVFIFYSRYEMYEDISTMLISAFDFTTDKTSDVG